MSNMVFYFIFTETSLRKWLVEKQPVHASLLANFFFFALCTRIYMHKNNFLFCFQLNSFCFVLILMTFCSNCQTKFSAHFFVCQLLFFFFNFVFLYLTLVLQCMCVEILLIFTFLLGCFFGRFGFVFVAILSLLKTDHLLRDGRRNELLLFQWNFSVFFFPRNFCQTPFLHRGGCCCSLV